MTKVVLKDACIAGNPTDDKEDISLSCTLDLGFSIPKN
jgi:hypothetical protein